MDFETQRKKRMQDLEEKRRRLDEMRKLRKDRTDAAEDIPTTVENSQKAASVATSSTTIASSADERAQVDDLVTSLLVSTLHESTPSTNTTITSSSGINSSNLPLPPLDRKQAIRAKALTLTLSKCSSGIQILPTLRETYDKSSQTDLLPVHENEGRDRDNVPLDHLETPLKRTGSYGTEKGQQLGSTLSLTSPSHRDATPSSSHPISSPHSPLAATMRRKLLSEEDQKDILNNEGFRTFMHSSLRLMERSLAQVNNGYDILKDYTRSDDRGGSLSRESEGNLLVYRSMFDILRCGEVGNRDKDRYSHSSSSLKGRPVMDLHCSPHYPELILAAYGSKISTHKLQDNNSSNSSSGSANHHSLDDAPGLVAVWSLGLPTRPEYIFTSLSPVVTARFHSEEPHLILGGCYSGQILLWDMRMKSFLPVQRSSLATGTGHKHPICGMSMVRSGPTLELITASSDGTFCHWDPQQLSEPSNVSRLQPSITELSQALGGSGSGLGNMTAATTGNGGITGGGGFNLVNVSSVTFSREDSSASAHEFIVGGGNGALYRGSLPFRPPSDKLKAHPHAHMGLITAIHPHPKSQQGATGCKVARSLVLTSSIDWTVKLWSLPPGRTTNTTTTANTSTSGMADPLFQFHSSSYDYFCDVQWSPTHTALFATITSGGHVALWNLVKSTSEAVATLRITNDEINSEVMMMGGGGHVASSSSSSSGGNSSSSGISGSGSSSGGSNSGSGSGSGSGGGALNKLVWSHDGRTLYVGDAKGCIHMIGVHEALLKATPAEEGVLELLLLRTSVNDKETSST